MGAQRERLVNNLQFARSQLKDLKEKGFGDQIQGTGSEATSLQNNMDSLQQRKADVRNWKHKFVETKASCGGDANHPEV